MIVNDVVHLKLQNGDDLVAFVTESKDDQVRMEFPALLTKQENGYQFTKWFPFSTSKNVYHVDKSNIMEYSDVSDDVKQNYIMYAVHTTNNKYRPPDEQDLDFDEFIDDLEEDPKIH